jgi:hypothetical protein
VSRSQHGIRCIANVTYPSPNEGQPVPELNLVSLEYSGVPQPAQENVPLRFSLTKIEEFGRSVPPCRSTLYCAPDSTYAHSRSLRCTLYPSVLLLSRGAGVAAAARCAPAAALANPAPAAGMHCSALRRLSWSEDAGARRSAAAVANTRIVCITECEGRGNGGRGTMTWSLKFDLVPCHLSVP